MNRQGMVSVFKRLFGIFLLMVIIIYIVIAVIFMQYVEQQRKIDRQAYSNLVESSAAVIEQQLKAVYNIELQLLQDSRVKRLAYNTYTNEYERACLILELLAHIQSTQSVNRVIEDIVLVIPSQGVELSAVKGYHRKDYESGNMDYESGNKYQLLTMKEEKLELNIAYPLSVSRKESYVPDYIIRIILSDAYLDGYLHFRTMYRLKAGIYSSTQNGLVWKTLNTLWVCRSLAVL